MAKKKAPMPVATTKKKAPRRSGTPVRLDLRPEDMERLERVSQARGLSKASFARMAVLAMIKTEEANI